MDVLDHDGPLIVGVHEDQSLVSFRPDDMQARTILEAAAHTARGGLFCVPGSPWVLFTQEERGELGVRRSLVACQVLVGRVVSLVQGRDFFADVVVNPDGAEMAWCSWDHPNMPWEAGEIWTASFALDDLSIQVGAASKVAGGIGAPASRPSFAADGSLLWLMEDQGWARPWRRDVEGRSSPLCTGEIEFGGPFWVLGQRQLLEVAGAVCSIEHRGGVASPVLLGASGIRALDEAASAVDELCATPTSLAWISPTAWTLASVGVVRPSIGRPSRSLALGPAIDLEPGDVSVARSVVGESRHGGAIHGLYYAPASTVHCGLDGELPPVIVFCHGGPTASARAGFDPTVQLMTSRGFAVVAVNYAGSTGYGAPYRHRLEGAWGLVDVEDCADLISSLAAQRLVDGSRAAIRGSSAGGFTALLGLTTGTFCCAVSWYGVADLLSLVESTHDFEARYLDGLIGPLPDAMPLYIERSPVSRASEMRGAVLLLQGLDDPVVPVGQARSMADALRAKGHEVSLIEFEGESHGFRRFETLRASLEAEIAFYQEHLCRGIG
jgi:dipeptidyl aminopeptidase/acylaminoacyl peptidase